MKMRRQLPAATAVPAASTSPAPSSLSSTANLATAYGAEDKYIEKKEHQINKILKHTENAPTAAPASTSPAPSSLSSTANLATAYGAEDKYIEKKEHQINKVLKHTEDAPKQPLATQRPEAPQPDNTEIARLISEMIRKELREELTEFRAQAVQEQEEMRKEFRDLVEQRKQETGAEEDVQSLDTGDTVNNMNDCPIKDDSVNQNQDETTFTADQTLGGARRKTTFKQPQPQQDDLSSVVSLGTSILETNPVKKMLYKLKMEKQKAETALYQHSTELKLLEFTKADLVKAIEKLEEEGSSLPPMNHAEEDEINKLDGELKELDYNIGLMISKIHKDSENARRAPRAQFPQFSGNALEFLSFQDEMDHCLKYMEDHQKQTSYRKAMTGPKKEELLEHISNCESYEAMKDAMFNKYGCFDSLLPAEIAKIRNLQEVGDKDFRAENSNIQKIICFMRWLITHDRTSTFSKDLIMDCKQKLRENSQEYLFHNRCEDMMQFKRFLERQQSHNFERLATKPQRIEKRAGMRKSPPPTTRGMTSTRSTTISNPKKTPSCLICRGGHWTNNCTQLQSVSTVNDVRGILHSKNICPCCLVTNNSEHKNKCRDKYYSKAQGRFMSKVCNKCSSGLSWRICPCSSNTTNTHHATIEEISPTSTVQPVTTLPAVPMPGSGARTMQNVNIQVLHSAIYINGTPLGSSLCAQQDLELIAPDGSVVSILCLWDTGAENTMISTNLEGYFHSTMDVTYTFQQCTSTECITGKIATVCLRMRDGRLYNIQALAQNLNTTFVDTKEVQIPVHWQTKYGLPSTHYTTAGPCTIIFGRDLTRLFPVELDRDENLTLYKSCFNNELIVAGSNCTTPMGNYTKNMKARFSPADHEWLNKMSPPDFSVLPRVCSKCKEHDCNVCKSSLLKSPKVRWEEETLTSCLKFIKEPQEDGQEGYWEVHGKYNQHLQFVPSLKEETKRFQLKLEAGKLKQNPQLNEEFNAAMFKRINNGNFAFLEDVVKKDPSILNHQCVYSPVNYSIKENSNSTKVRPVINSSFSPGKNLPTLNEAMFTGSSLNKNIQDILLKMRQYQYIGQSDINNFYQSLRLSPRDQALNMMLFRKQGWNMPGEIHTLISLTLNYGQTHSQFLANKAKLLTSETYIKPRSNRCHLMMEDSLTDDVFVGGFNLEQVKHLASITTEGFYKASFTLKPWVYSTLSDQEIVVGRPETQGCLGLRWSSKDDTWQIPVNFNLAPKRRGVKDKDFAIDSYETARHLFNMHGITKRIALRICHSTYDPNSLLIQVKTTMHLLYRKLITTCPNLNWEDQIPTSLHQEWLLAIKMALECGKITIPRFCMKDCADLKAQLGIFVDGSGFASCARLFLRYKKKDGSIGCLYLTGWTKLAPNGIQAAPKTECEAALGGLRLGELVCNLLTDITITDIYLFSDSTITLGGITGLTCTQKLYYSQRNWESQNIITKLNVQLFHTNSDNQDADIGSKLDLHRNYALEDFYWESKWFYKDMTDWPVVQYQFQPAHTSTIQNPRMTVSVKNTNIGTSIINTVTQRFNSFRKITKTTAYIFLWLKYVPTLAEGSTKAKHFILRMLQISKSELTGIERQFMVTNTDGLHYVMPRNYIMEGRSTAEKLILVSINERIGKTILNDCHTHCSSTGFEVAKMYQAGFYVTKHRGYFKKLQKSCFTCRRIRKEAVMALMGPNHQLQAAKNVPPFSIVFMDVLGYFKVRYSRNITGKLFILCITCIWSRYTVFIGLEDMTANSVLMGIKQAAYQLGAATPSIIYCDSATNFLPINKLDNTSTDTPDPDSTQKMVADLKKVLHSQQITLKASTPRSSWRNSLAESMVRCFKLCLRKSQMDHKTFTLPQWQYVISKIQFLVNSRPINLRFMEDSMCILTPAHLIFGSRKGVFPRNMELREESRLFTSLANLDRQILAFETIWFTTYGNELLKWTKFKHKSRSLAVGDVVFMLDKINTETKQPTLGIIKEVHSDRTVTIEYNKKTMKIDPNTYQVSKTSRKSLLQRPAQQLCYITSSQTGPITTDPFIPEDTATYTDVPAELDEEIEHREPGDESIPDQSGELHMGPDNPQHTLVPDQSGELHMGPDNPQHTLVSEQSGELHMGPDTSAKTNEEVTDLETAQPRPRVPLKIQYDDEVPMIVDISKRRRCKKTLKNQVSQLLPPNV